MKIKSLQLKNFKRFTDLTIQDIPESAKLVLLIGSNGSGKSSVFDAFEYISETRKADSKTKTPNGIDQKFYYGKDSKAETKVICATYTGLLINGFSPEQLGHHGGFSGSIEPTNKSFYGRSAVRYLPRLERTVIGTPISIANDGDRPKYYIERDDRFENDIELLLLEVVQKVFSDLNGNTSGKIDELKLFKMRINDALKRIFNSTSYTQIELINFQTPADGKPSQLIFQKGKSVINYDLLSAGEKEIINLLINLYVRTKYFDDTIYFFDEIDAHLNTKLQYEVIKEITENWIPQNCQLWTASHSLGFIQYAKEAEHAVIIDFDDYDFDEAKVLTPEPKDNSDLYEIAVSKEILPDLFKDREIYFVENEDKKYYAELNLDKKLFVPEGNRDKVFFKTIKGNFNGLVDRDFLTDEDIIIIEKEYPNLIILRLYCVENYLFHPENLKEYYQQNGKFLNETSYIGALVEEKNKVKNSLSRKVASIRQGYPYFKEHDLKSSYKKRFTPDAENYEQTDRIAHYLDSDDYNIFLKAFSLKDNGKSLSERQNISPSDLAKTDWFKKQIENILTKTR